MGVDRARPDRIHTLHMHVKRMKRSGKITKLIALIKAHHEKGEKFVIYHFVLLSISLRRLTNNRSVRKCCISKWGFSLELLYLDTSQPRAHRMKQSMD